MYYDERLPVVYLITSNKYFKNLHCVLIFNLSVSTYPSCSNSPPLPNSTNQEISMFYRDCLFVKVIFYHGCFAHSEEQTIVTVPVVCVLVLACTPRKSKLFLLCLRARARNYFSIFNIFRPRVQSGAMENFL